jgi:hypothetical protein
MRSIASRRMVQFAASLALAGASFETRFARLLRTRTAWELLRDKREPVENTQNGNGQAL